MVEQLKLTNTEVLENNRVAIATTTFYKDWLKEQTGQTSSVDQLRGDLAIKTISFAKESGYQVIVIDGGSSLDFVNHLINIGIKPITQKESGMGASR